MLFSSGIGRYLREILLRHPTPTASFDIFCHPGAQEDWLRAHIPAARCRLTTAPLYSSHEQLLAWRLPRDVTYWVPHYNVPLLVRCRLIATVHDLAPLALPRLFDGGLRQWAARFYFRALRQRTQRILTVSQFSRTEMHALGLNSSHPVSVVPNGVGAFWSGGTPAAVPGNRVLYVGNLKPHKNLERLIAAMEIVRKTHPLELDIAGRIEGFRTGLSRTFIDKLRTAPWIRLLGEVSDHELRRHYHEASALVFPSLYEGFGLPLLEAMAAGCPVLSSRAGALVEVAGRARELGGVVEYFDPRDPQDIAAALLRHTRLSAPERIRIQHDGRQIAAAYSWDKTAAATWALLTERT